MPLVHPNLPDELPDEYDFMRRLWTADTRCVHCSSRLGSRIYHPSGVPLCTDCSETTLIAVQYQDL